MNSSVIGIRAYTLLLAALFGWTSGTALADDLITRGKYFVDAGDS